MIVEFAQSKEKRFFPKSDGRDCIKSFCWKVVHYSKKTLYCFVLFYKVTIKNFENRVALHKTIH